MAATSPAAPASKRAPQMRGFAVICGVVALIVLLIGGYAGHWAWTGFSDNDTLWDWLQLLLLPIAIATLPIWVRHGRFMDARVRIGLGVGLLVFGAIVLLGYLMPWKWTGFTGNTLWDWLGLVLLPFVIATIRYWSELRPRITGRHVVVATVSATLLVALVVIGYVRPWKWTGFTGNTLWDWIQLVAVPLLFPLVIMPAALNLISTGLEDRRMAEEGPEEGEAPPAAVAQAPAPPPAAPAGRMGIAVALAAIVALVIGGVAGALAFGDNGSSPSSTQAAKPAAATPCTAAKAQTVAADNELTVVQSGNTFYACGKGAAKPLSLGAAGAASAFAVAGGRVAYAARTCAAGDTDCSTLVKLTRLSDGHVFAPQRFKGGTAVAKIVATKSGGMAVMTRDPDQLWALDKQGPRRIASGNGLDPDSLAYAGGTVYWRSNGRAQAANLGPCAIC